MSRIKTTHTGSLPRPSDLLPLLLEMDETGIAPANLREETLKATDDIVARQKSLGLDVINDGEQGRTTFTAYVLGRLSGFGGESAPTKTYDGEHFPDYANMMSKLRGRSLHKNPACTGPITLRDPQAIHDDIAALKSAAEKAGVDNDSLFMSAASPGVLSIMFDNQFYDTRDDYLAALVDVMRTEYRAIVDSGLMLQLDCPDLAMTFNTTFRDLSLDEFRREVARSVETLNAALEGLPSDRIRMHVCWGNAESPHVHDVALADIIDLVLLAHPDGISLEACNPRHGHEWKLFEDVKLPESKYLIPGVIDSTTNFVEHPELVAQRIRNYTQIVGTEKVLAGSDCGFGTGAGISRVAPSVVWEKLSSLVQGAEIASAK